MRILDDRRLIANAVGPSMTVTFAALSFYGLGDVRMAPRRLEAMCSTVGG